MTSWRNPSYTDSVQAIRARLGCMGSFGGKTCEKCQAVRKIKSRKSMDNQFPVKNVGSVRVGDFVWQNGILELVTVVFLMDFHLKCHVCLLFHHVCIKNRDEYVLHIYMYFIDILGNTRGLYERSLYGRCRESNNTFEEAVHDLICIILTVLQSEISTMH